MDTGFLRLPIAALAAVALFAGGCGEQMVAFREPAGATVLLDGQFRGTVPFDAELSRDRVYAVELKPSAEALAEMRKVKPDASVKGLLVLPRSASPASTFRVSEAKLAVALQTGAVVRWAESGADGLTLYFKGSAAGIAADDEEVICYVPAPSGGGFRGAVLAVWDGTLIVIEVIVVATAAVFLLVAASRTCVGQEVRDSQ